MAQVNDKNKRRNERDELSGKDSEFHMRTEVQQHGKHRGTNLEYIHQEVENDDVN